MVYVAGRNAPHGSVNHLLQVTLAFVLVLQFNNKHVPLTKGGIVNEGKFSPPVGGGGVTEQPVVNPGDELTVLNFVKFADAHVIIRYAP